MQNTPVALQVTSAARFTLSPFSQRYPLTPPPCGFVLLAVGNTALRSAVKTSFAEDLLMSKGLILYRDVLAATWHKIAGTAVIARDLSGAFDRSDRINAGFNTVSPGSSVIFAVAIDLHLELALGALGEQIRSCGIQPARQAQLTS